jgi:conjugal transfer ATP-binding protein TraC
MPKIKFGRKTKQQQDSKPSTPSTDSEEVRPDEATETEADQVKPEKLSFTQDAIPVKRIHHGLIETTDGRYVRIAEILPTNFMLRSEDEKENIIYSFASFLKICPIKMQIKIISRRTDTEKHIAQIREEQKKETNEQCRKLSEDYISLVRQVASREAIQRQFFLIYEFNAQGQPSSELGDVLSYFATVEQTMRAYFTQCGNVVVEPENRDEQLHEILYNYFNRTSSIEEPFTQRVNRVLRDAMTAKGLTLGRDSLNELTINCRHFFAPRGIEYHPDYFLMDGLYYTVLYIQSDGYPYYCSPGWTSTLINAGEGVDIDIHLTKEDRSKTIDRVARQIRLNRTKLKSTQDTGSDYEELTNSINSGYYIKSGIANRNEDLFYMCLFITISAPTLKEMTFRSKKMLNMLKSMDLSAYTCKYRMEDALEAVMPLNYVPASLFRKSHRNMLTSSAAASYPFTSFEMSDNTGIMLGINRHNNSLCIIDLFDTKKNKNANMTIVGTSGAGKTFTSQLLMLRMRERGIQVFIIAPIKGHEFSRACEEIGGQFVRISPGSNQCINIMEIRKTTTPEMELLDGAVYSENDSLLARKIQQMMIFMQMIVPNMSNEEEQMVDEALIACYRRFGIDYDNDTLYVDEGHTKYKTMPVLGDLHQELCANEMTKQIALVLGRFVNGSASTFNHQTNVDLDNKYIVFDLSELKGTLLPVGMLIVLDYVWDKIKADRTQRKAVLIDEIWQLIGASANHLAAEFCLEIFKLIRGYGGAAIAATQDLTDFFALDGGKYGRAIINNSKNKIVLNLEPDEAETVRETLKLTKQEVRNVTQFERGQALICSNNSKIAVQIKASPLEHSLITTDRAELEQIAAQRVKQMSIIHSEEI